MAQLNRDKETLYTPGRLSRWFLVTSGLLTLSLVWMVWADYDRPWKTTQADFYRRQSKLLAAARQVEDAELFRAPTEAGERLAKRKKELDAKIAEAKRRLELEPTKSELGKLRDEVKQQDVLLEEADRNIKSQKGKYSEAKWQLEWARKTSSDPAHDPTIERLDARVNDIAQEQARWEQRRRPADVARTATLDRIAVLTKDVTDAEKEREELEKPVADVEKRRAATEAKTEKDVWRNLPIADIVSPTISIDKAVTANIHDDYNFATLPKIDVCMTCHRGIGDKTMELPVVRDLMAKFVRVKIGETAWSKIKGAIGTDTDVVVPVVRPDALSEDPKKGIPTRTTYAFTDWTPPWTVESFKAWTETPGASLVYDESKNEHPPKGLLPKKLLEDSLPADQYAALVKPDVFEPFRVHAVEWAHPHLDLLVSATGKHPVSTTGCTVCHGGRGRATDFTRAAHTPSSEEQGERWRHDYTWSEADMWDWPMLPKPYVEGQCLKCHLPSVEWTPRTERLGLRDLADPITEAKAPKSLDSPRERLEHAAHDQAALRAFDQLLDRSHLAGQWSKAAANADYAGQIAAIELDAQHAAHETWEPERLEKGVTIFRDWGCVGCHTVKGFAPSPGWNATAPRRPGEEGDFSTPEPGTQVWADSGPRKVGPDLRHVAEKMVDGFVPRWIDNPNAFRIDTRMPSFFHVREHDDDYAYDERHPVDRTVVVDPTPRDHAQTNVEPLALARYLQAASTPLAGGYPDVPKGDPKKGAETFYSVGCFACHIGPGKYDAAGTRTADDGARFRLRGEIDPKDGKHEKRLLPELAPGPRLVGMGSKVKAPWLYEWLREPRHYWSATIMPNMRWRDELGDDGKTVVRTADQVRADVVAYLLSSTNPDFEKQVAPGEGDRWTEESDRLLDDMWLEWYGKGQYYGPAPAPDTSKDPAAGRVFRIGATDDEALKAVRERPLDRKLIEVGYRLVGQRGCFGCHNVGGYEYRENGKLVYAFTGYENEQPIGKELSAEGSQDLHKFDFGLLLAKHEVEDTRWAWIDTKLREPRIWDKGRFLPRWTDKLRMPKFNFRTEDREAVVTTVLGMVKEPIQPSALYRPDSKMERVARGRTVVARYHCNQCHTVEGLRGIAIASQLAENKEQWMLPPNLYSEGNRVQSTWLFRFVKNPDDPRVTIDGMIRPSVIQRMPKFRMSDSEASSLVDYFLALADRTDRMWTDAHDRPLDETPFSQPLSVTVKDESGKNEHPFTLRSEVEEAKGLFDTFNCVKCHLKKGTPGADPNDGGTAPPFALAKDRLRTDWIVEMLHDPQSQIENTKMVAFWPLKAKRARKPENDRKVSFPQFLFGLRGQDKVDADPLAESQMDALARYLRYHFHDAAPPPTEPVSK